MRSDVPAEKLKNFIEIKFLNTAVDAINLLALLRSTSVTDKFQSNLKIKSHQLYHMNTLALLAANYLTLHQPLNLNFLIISLINKPASVWLCQKPHGLIITGDLKVIENAKLREIVAKVPEYR